MRGGLVAAILVSVLAALDAGVAIAAPITPDPQRIILRLVDLGPGWRFGNDDTGCPAERGEVEFGVATTPDRLLSCTTQFRGPAPRNDYVDSGAWVFETESGAKSNYRLHRSLLSTSNALPSEQPLTASVPIGDETTMYEGQTWNGDTTSLIWRSGRVISFVAAAASSSDHSYERAIALARTQQARVLNPSPVGPRDNSQMWSFLNDPNLGFDVYWLGERFDPPGPLPARPLVDADYWGGPGWRARVIYRGAIDLGLWKPRRWVRFKNSRLGQHFLCNHCGKQRHRRLSGRRATLFAVRPECLPRKLPPESIAIDGPPKPCRSHRPNLFMAAVRIRDTVVSVNVPVCFTCGNTARDPYNSVHGVRAIAAGLELRAPQR